MAQLYSRLAALLSFYWAQARGVIKILAVYRILRNWVRIGLLGSSCLGVAMPLRANSNYETVFEAVWDDIAQSYYDPDFGGKDWRSIGEKYRNRLGTLDESEDFDALLSEMLGELGDSHFSVISPSFNELMPNPWQRGDSGITLAIVGNRPIIHRVRPESRAALNGIKPGYELVSADSMTVQSLGSLVDEADVFDRTAPYYFLKAIENRLYGPPGRKIELLIKPNRFSRTRSYSIELQEYAGRMSSPLGNIGESPIEIDKRILENDVAYIRFTLWMPSLMEEIRTYIKSIDESVKGLIIDIRGNPGGIGLMATGLAGMLVDDEYLMGTMRLRQGYLNYNVYPQKGAFLGPLAILVDNNSISTSEIFAADMKETGRGRVFGSRTPGAALPSLFKRLPNRYFLQMAIADYGTANGTRIEGVGVHPDFKVELSPAGLRQGRDNVIEAAQKWILRQN